MDPSPSRPDQSHRWLMPQRCVPSVKWAEPAPPPPAPCSPSFGWKASPLGHELPPPHARCCVEVLRGLGRCCPWLGAQQPSGACQPGAARKPPSLLQAEALSPPWTGRAVARCVRNSARSPGFYGFGGCLVCLLCVRPVGSLGVTQCPEHPLCRQETQGPET